MPLLSIEGAQSFHVRLWRVERLKADPSPLVPDSLSGRSLSLLVPRKHTSPAEQPGAAADGWVLAASGRPRLGAGTIVDLSSLLGMILAPERGDYINPARGRLPSPGD